MVGLAIAKSYCPINSRLTLSASQGHPGKKSGQGAGPRPLDMTYWRAAHDAPGKSAGWLLLCRIPGAFCSISCRTKKWWNVKSKDPRFNDAGIYIREAIRTLETAQMNHHLDHTDVTIVGAALEGLDIIQRSIGGPHRSHDSRIAARLRQVANAVKTCAEPSLTITFTDLDTAAEIFEIIAAEGAAAP